MSVFGKGCMAGGYQYDWGKDVVEALCDLSQFAP